MTSSNPIYFKYSTLSALPADPMTLHPTALHTYPAVAPTAPAAPLIKTVYPALIYPISCNGT